MLGVRGYAARQDVRFEDMCSLRVYFLLPIFLVCVLSGSLGAYCRVLDSIAYVPTRFKGCAPRAKISIRTITINSLLYTFTSTRIYNCIRNIFSSVI